MTDAVIAKYKPMLEGKKLCFMLVGLRPRHVIGALRRFRNGSNGTGYEFGHGDDYKRTKR